ncbi:MAG: hypothetical protein HRU76_11335 [Phycisphaeraceae bacterium]|nr:MAG: hypothetical protein HRU76_11335 [Phycisphaeraceae bacterium]
MTTYLARRQSDWLLAAFAPHLRGCNLSTVVSPTVAQERFQLWQGRIWVQSEADPREVVFYPRLLYRGWLVTPERWHHTGAEPILLVRMGVEEISKAGGLKETMEARRELETDGWDWSRMEEGLKYVHVDQLEKVEGPPPEGAF